MGATVVVAGLLGLVLAWYAYRVMWDGGERVDQAGARSKSLLMVEVVIGAFAWAQLARSAGADGWAGASGGALYALVTIPVVLTAAHAPLVRFGVELMLGVLGLLALVPAVAAFVEDTPCAAVGSPVLRMLYVVLFALVAGGAAVASLAVRSLSRRRGPAGIGGLALGWYALVEAALLASETGGTAQGALGLTVAAIAGALLPLGPEIVLTALAAALVGLSALSMSSGVQQCGERSTGMLGFLAGSAAVAVVTTLAWRALVRRR